MTRLVVSDLDGTLLPAHDRQLPDRCFEIVRALRARNIAFAVATGRCYSDCRRLLAPVAGEIGYVASDGAAVFLGNQLLQSFPLDRTAAMTLAAEGYDQPGVETLLVGRYTTYCRPKTPAFANRVRSALHGHLQVVEHYGQVEEPILKVSFHHPDSTDFFDRCVTRWQNRAQVAYAANGWLELVAPGVDKGSGLRVLMEHLEAEPAETAAFGDGYNDRALFEAAGESWAVDTAPEEIRAIADHTCKDVLATIAQQLLK